MALEIIINYTPGITSTSFDSPFICHRICYRQNGSGAYCCIEDTTDSTAGVPKVFTIIVDGTASPSLCPGIPIVDPESCIDTEYDGYVQACCEDEASLAGRVYWTTVFTPDPSCVNKNTCCENIRALDDGFFLITNAGTGYTPLSTVPVTIVRDPLDTQVSDATVVANTNGLGVIITFTVSVAGLYEKIPLVVIDPPASGTQATAVLRIPCTDDEIGLVDGYKDTCEDLGTGEFVSLLLGECAHYCYPKAHPWIYNTADLTGSPDFTNFSYVTEGCCDCTTCSNYTVVISSTKATVDVVYTVCSFGATPSTEATVSLVNGSHTLECVVPGSIYCTDDSNAIVSIVATGSGTCCVT